MSLPNQREQTETREVNTHGQDENMLVFQCCTEHCNGQCAARNQHKRPCRKCLAEVRGQ